MAPRITVRIELTQNAKDKVEQIAEHRGMTQSALLTRLVEWFANQDGKLQGIVLDHYPPEIAKDVAALLLKSSKR